MEFISELIRSANIFSDVNKQRSECIVSKYNSVIDHFWGRNPPVDGPNLSKKIIKNPGEPGVVDFFSHEFRSLTWPCANWRRPAQCAIKWAVQCADVGRQLISGQKQKQQPPPSPPLPQPPLPSQPPPQVLSPLSPACAGLSCNFHPGWPWSLQLNCYQINTTRADSEME